MFIQKKKNITDWYIYLFVLGFYLFFFVLNLIMFEIFHHYQRHTLKDIVDSILCIISPKHFNSFAKNRVEKGRCNDQVFEFDCVDDPVENIIQGFKNHSRIAAINENIHRTNFNFSPVRTELVAKDKCNLNQITLYVRKPCKLCVEKILMITMNNLNHD